MASFTKHERAMLPSPGGWLAIHELKAGKLPSVPWPTNMRGLTPARTVHQPRLYDLEQSFDLIKPQYHTLESKMRNYYQIDIYTVNVIPHL